MLPKGISRHLVRFANLSGHVIAVKETTEVMAKGEYEMLRTLQRMEVPCVEPVAVITNRIDHEGDPLAPALVTRHLKFSLPYRALFSQTLRPDTATRLVDALAVLLVRLHMIGFFWGDVSLSNTLFRRDAGAFAAYLVDAETGQLYTGGLSNGQRENDLEIARVNIAGELMDLEAGGRVADELDPIRISNGIVEAYRLLWKELTGSESFDSSERWRISERVDRLNKLGFDIEELAIRTTDEGSTVRIQPKVVDAGHHQRRLLRLTGLDAEENQARRLLNDLDSYARHLRQERPRRGDGRPRVARCASSSPSCAPSRSDLKGKLEPAEVFHQLLEHRWFMAQNAGPRHPPGRGRDQLHQRRAAPPPRRGDDDRSADRRLHRADLGHPRCRPDSDCERGLAPQGVTDPTSPSKDAASTCQVIIPFGSQSMVSVRSSGLPTRVAVFSMRRPRSAISSAVAHSDTARTPFTTETRQ